MIFGLEFNYFSVPIEFEFFIYAVPLPDPTFMMCPSFNKSDSAFSIFSGYIPAFYSAYCDCKISFIYSVSPRKAPAL